MGTKNRCLQHEWKVINSVAVAKLTTVSPENKVRKKCQEPQCINSLEKALRVK